MTTKEAKIVILSGKSQRGKAMGCTGDQVYAVLVGDDGDLYATGPHDDGHSARAEARKWAVANGVEIAGDHRPRAITGDDADVRANSPRY